MNNYIPLIIGMTIVTYIPRFLPLMILSEDVIKPKARRFLQYIPYTSLSILLIRGILTSSAEMRLPTIVGIVMSAFMAYIKGNLVISVLSGIFATFITIHFIGI